VPKIPYPDRRLLMSVDMEHYSRGDNPWQYEAQETLQRVMWQAATSVGLARDRWERQPTGDGELAALPADTPEPVAVLRLAPALDEILRDYNRHLLPAARVRLRVALHSGLAHLNAANGWAGEAVNTVCRLVDAPALKQAMAAFPAAGAGLIVSEPVYRDVVVHYGEEVRRARFARVSVHNKEFQAGAWIFIPEEDASALPPVPEIGLAGGGSGEQSPHLGGGVPGRAGPARVHIGTSTVSGTFVIGDGTQATTTVRPDQPGTKGPQ
jgi:hypothetical protein